MSWHAKHYAAIGVLFVSSLINTAVSSPDLKRVCPDELNPFNIRPYTVPKENKDDPNTDQLALYWIPREDVGCQLNHNDDLKKKVNFNGSASAFLDTNSRLYVSDRCHDSVTYWLDRIIKVVQHNLLVTMKVKAIRFFEPHHSFKRFQFKDLPIAGLPPDQILQTLEKTGQDLRNGFTLPNNADAPSFESYNQTFSESLRVYHGLYHAFLSLQSVLFNRVNGCEKDDMHCLQKLYKTLIGESTDWSGRALGYAEIRKTVQDAIRLIRNYFRERPSDRDTTFDELKLPMIPPCFSTEFS